MRRDTIDVTLLSPLSLNLHYLSHLFDLLEVTVQTSRLDVLAPVHVIFDVVTQQRIVATVTHTTPHTHIIQSHTT